MIPRLKIQHDPGEELDRGRWEAGLTFRTYGLEIGVCARPRAILDRVPDRLPFGWEPAELSEVDRLYSIELTRDPEDEDGDSWRLWQDGTEIARGTTLEYILHGLESELKLYVAEWGKERIFLHAGVVGVHGKAVLLPGYSMAGKTTLVAELVRAGAAYYSDDFAVLDPLGMVHPFSTPLQVREHNTVEQTRWELDRLGGAAGSDPLPVGLVLLTHFQPGVRFRPRRVTPGRALLELLRYTPARSRPHESIDTLERVVRSAVVLKGARGEVEAAARIVLDRLLPKDVRHGS